MRRYIFNGKSIKDFEKLNKAIQERIIRKLDFYVSQENPLIFARKLVDSRLGEYRFRIGDYRVIFDVDEHGKIIIIAVIGNRKEIYKR